MSDFKPSAYQEAVFEWGKVNIAGNTHKNLVINAKAGSGKTTTLIQLSQRLPGDKSAIFVAFGKLIAEKLNADLKALGVTTMQAKTLHSIGYGMLAKFFKDKGSGNTRVNLQDNKFRDILKQDRFSKARYWECLMPVIRLGMANLINFDSAMQIERVIEQYDLPGPVDEDIDPELFYMIVRYVAQEAETQARAGLITFDEMIYYPAKWELTPYKTDIVMVDECQDLNLAQRAIMLRLAKKGGNTIAVGDPFQSIMGFAGASKNSFFEVKAALNADELPLSVCYRCSVPAITLAQTYVPDIQPSDKPPKGEVIRLAALANITVEQQVIDKAAKGDWIICRRTAPLIKLCIQLIGAGKAAKVKGRDIGANLVAVIKALKKMGCVDLGELPDYLKRWQVSQIEYLAKLDDGDSKIEALTDKCAAISACYERYAPTCDGRIDCLTSAIEALFSDGDEPITLSTIHKAKGQQANRVFILDYNTLPMVWKGQSKDQHQQEINCTYVAITRSLGDLILCGSAPEPQLTAREVGSIEATLVDLPTKRALMIRPAMALIPYVAPAPITRHIAIRITVGVSSPVKVKRVDPYDDPARVEAFRLAVAAIPKQSFQRMYLIEQARVRIFGDTWSPLKPTERKANETSTRYR